MTLGLLDAGARVAAVEIDTPSLGELRDLAEDRKADDRLLDIAGDVTHDTAAPKIVRATSERFGRVDVLINNAGISTGLLRGGEQITGPLS
jgi:NAD(P)-dependent dehydrogenase (short-subunit alcohol dehydrogenase family)